MGSPDLRVSQVLPWLLLGSQDVAADQEILRREGITHVLNVASGIEIDRTGTDLVEERIELLDLPEQEIQDGVSRCVQYLATREEAAERVLVHCNAGVSRAPTVVLAFLILHHNLSFQAAWDTVLAVRPYIRPNDGFIRQLKELKLNVANCPVSK